VNQPYWSVLYCLKCKREHDSYFTFDIPVRGHYQWKCPFCNSRNYVAERDKFMTDDFIYTIEEILIEDNKYEVLKILDREVK